MQAETIAVIDIGTNTFHLVIVDFSPQGSYHIVEKYKEPVKLGEGGITKNKIAPAAYARGLTALEKFSRMIEARGVKKVLAIATSAVRGAQNGQDFVRDAYAKTGIQIKVIHGSEEAGLIYLGIRNGVNLPYGENVLIVDIGGGSVEFIVANRMNVKLLRSVDIGAQRMLELMKPSDPIASNQIHKTVDYYAKQLTELMEELKDFNIQTLIGSSGTFETLAMLSAIEGKKKMETALMNGFQIELDHYRTVSQRLLKSSRGERAEMPGMDPVRIDMIIMGTILVQYLVENLPLKRMLLSNYALKEGILFNYLEEARYAPQEATGGAQRENGVLNLADRFNPKDGHAAQVSKLALSIFDQTKYLHNFGAWEREMLHYAALLHDIGHFINRSGHHKHGQYIVQNANLPGFNSDELMVLSNLVRYHRKSLPSREHFHYNLMYKEHKTAVNKLGGILRIADNLDRTHANAVTHVDLKFEPNLIVFQVHSRQPADIELENARIMADLFVQAFETQVRFDNRVD